MSLNQQKLLTQAVIIQEKVLMVRQFVERGDVVWNFPGGGIELGETAEQACIREVSEETGYKIAINCLLTIRDGKYTYLAEIIDGNLYLDSLNESNKDILDVCWIPI